MHRYRASLKPASIRCLRFCHQPLNCAAGNQHFQPIFLFHVAVISAPTTCARSIASGGISSNNNTGQSGFGKMGLDSRFQQKNNSQKESESAKKRPSTIKTMALTTLERACDRFEDALYKLEKRFGFVRRQTAAAERAEREKFGSNKDANETAATEASQSSSTKNKPQSSRTERTYVVHREGEAKVKKLRQIMESLGKDRVDRDAKEPFRLWDYLKKTEWKAAASFFLAWQAIALIIVPMKTGTGDIVEAFQNSRLVHQPVANETTTTTSTAAPTGNGDLAANTVSAVIPSAAVATQQPHNPRKEAEAAQREYLQQEVKKRKKELALKKTRLTMVEQHAEERIKELEAEIRRLGATPVTEQPNVLMRKS